jgi:formylmethanofuran dehydrogenase subunit E
MNTLGVERDREGQLLALVELGDDYCSHCLADGIQMITGCTLGKGNVKQLGYGKSGLTLVDRVTGRAVRVVPRAEAQNRTKETTFFRDYRLQHVPASEVPDEVVDPLIQQVLEAPEEAIVRVSEELRLKVPRPTESFASFVCELCGDEVVEEYGRVTGSRKVCIPCQQRALIRG